MPRPKSNGPYAKLSATYYLDDAILEAGTEAELLFARCLAFTAASNSDGFITERQMKTVGIALRNLPRRVEALIEVGLLVAGDGGYSIRSWLRWNKSASDIGRDLKRDRERKARTKMHGGDSGLHGDDSGMHGHDSEMTQSRLRDDSGPHGGAHNDDDLSSADPHDYGPNPDHSDRNTGGIQVDSGSQVKSVQVKSSQATVNAPSVLASGFDAAWAHWPKKVERKQSFERFKTAVKEVDITELVNTIIRFGQAYAATTERQFVPSLSSWLHKERWTDELPTATTRQTHTDRNLDFVAQLAAEERQAQRQKEISA